MGNFLNSPSHVEKDADTNQSFEWTYDTQDEKIEQDFVDTTHKKNWYFYFGNRYNKHAIDLE